MFFFQRIYAEEKQWSAMYVYLIVELFYKQVSEC